MLGTLAAAAMGARAGNPLGPLKRVGNLKLEDFDRGFTHARPPASRGLRISSALRAQSRHRAESGDENINFNSRFGSPNLNDTFLNLRMSSKIESKMVPKPILFYPLGCLEGFGDPSGAKRALELCKYLCIPIAREFDFLQL